MEVMCNPKGGRTATPAFQAILLMIVSMMLLNAYCCGASVLAKSNTSFRCSSGRLDECLIEEDLELELGFLMNPHVSRILAGGRGTGDTGNPNKPAPCGQIKTDSPQYSSCIASIKGKKNACNPKGAYQRCKPP